MRRATFVPAVLAALLTAGCSLDYEGAMIRETMEESIPDLVLDNVEHVMVSDGEIVARLEATRAVQYDKRSESQLEDVHFREYGHEGEVLTEVWADRAVWHTDTENAEATGDIYLFSHKQNAEVLAQSLIWTKEDRVLEAGEGDEVLLRRDDGSELEGKGFRADFRRSELRLEASRGVYVYDDEKAPASEDGAEPEGQTAPVGEPEPGEANTDAL